VSGEPQCGHVDRGNLRNEGSQVTELGQVPTSTIMPNKFLVFRNQAGQSLVEFAVTLSLLLLITLVFIQLILIGAVALAAGQAAAWPLRCTE
jgi:hypothetical protein